MKEFEIPQNIRLLIQEKNWLTDKLKQGKPHHEILGLSNETMKKFHQIALNLLSNKSYEEAFNVFLLLTVLNPYQSDFWLGLGEASQKLLDFDMAIDAFEMAAISHLENPIPYFYLAKCFFSLHDRENALNAIELALEYSNGISEYEGIRKQALSAKLLILKEKEETP